MFSPKDKGSEYLKDKIFVGFVEDNLDDKRKGRIKVRVQGVFNDIEVDHIPWASPFRSLDGRSFCVPANGKIVNVIFPEGNLYEPQYIYSENYNINLKNKLDEYSDDEYKNFVALLFDHRTQIYSDDAALNLDYFDNVIRIKKKNIDIKLKDSQQKLNLGHSDCNQDAVLGTNFFTWFDSFMQILLIPSTLTGNVAAPILRPLLDQKILEYQSLRSTFVSNNVKIVNNNGIIADEYDNKRFGSPTKDDSTEVNGDKILTPKPELTPLMIKVKNEREKDMTEQEKSKPLDPNEEISTSGLTSINKNPGTIEGFTISNTEFELVQFHNINTLAPYPEYNISEVEQQKIEKNVKTKLNSDPYEGFWNREFPNKTSVSTVTTLNGTEKTITTTDDPYNGFWDNHKAVSKQDGYGSYSVPITKTSEKTDNDREPDGYTGKQTAFNPNPTQAKNIEHIVKYCVKEGIKNKYVLAGILGTIYKESGFIPKNEGGWSGTPPKRVRTYFGNGRCSAETMYKWWKDKRTLNQYSDSEIKELVTDNKKFFDLIYGETYHNNSKGDGWKYRGRGFNQITFKSAYEKYNKYFTEIDIIKNPDLLNTPIVAAQAVAKFMKTNMVVGFDYSIYKKLFGISVSHINDVETLDDGVKIAVCCNGGNDDLHQEGYEKASSVSQDMLRRVEEITGL